jgi:ketosteroid isomerase-like protein
MPDLVDVARDRMDAFNQGDVEAFVDHFTEDVEWWPLRSETGGHDGLRACFADSAETFDLLDTDVESAHEVPDGIVSFGALAVRGRGSMGRCACRSRGSSVSGATRCDGRGPTATAPRRSATRA